MEITFVSPIHLLLSFPLWTQGPLSLLFTSVPIYIQNLEKDLQKRSLQPHGLQSMEFSRPEQWSIPQYIFQPFLSPGHLPNPGIKPRPPALWADSLPAEPQGKPENTGVGSLSLLQQMFPTQELNPGLLHCRWILYQLSYGSPEKDIVGAS